MKVLVYGSGVICCYLAHILCAAGNDVTLLARGQWKEQLQQNGLIADLFGKTGYKLHWQSDMEAYLICHLAAVLPICYVAYACNGDLTTSTGEQRKLMRMASWEAYAMLKAQSIPILPEGDEQYYAPGIKGAVMRFLYFGMARWKTAGDLIACEHCRNAFEEMEMLDVDFEKVLAHKPEFPMPNWRALKAQMPGWDTIRKQYAKGSKK